MLLAGVLAAGSVLAWWLPSPLIDWQPALAESEPWRSFSAAFVHWSALHLGANLLGTAVVAALGRVGRLPWPAALAWALAWPMTQYALLLQPALAHYGGLSGVLHAGVAIAALWLLVQARGRGQARTRVLAAAVLAGLFIKLWTEDPFGPPLRSGGGWDIATAPLAHATGAGAGLLMAALVLLVQRKWQQPHRL